MGSKSTSRSQRSFRSLAIEPFRQIRIGAYVMILSIIFLISAGWMIFNAFAEQYRHIMSIFEIVDEKVKWELVNNDVFKGNAMRIGALFFSYVSIMFLMVFRMTHRIYGPLISIERFIEQLTEGKYSSRLRIRQKDDLQALAKKLNHLADSLEKKQSGGRSERRRGE